MERDPIAGPDQSWLYKHNLNLTPSQEQFCQSLRAWFENPCSKIILLSGGPGTGKTFVVNQLLKFDEHTLRMAWTGRSAQHIGGRTIHSTVRLKWGASSVYRRLEKELADEEDVDVCLEKSRPLLKEFTCDLTPRILVVDEVGMINAWTLYWLLVYFMEKSSEPTLCVLMGDRHQLSPVNSKYNVFSIVEKLREKYTLDYLHLLESKRFLPQYSLIIDRLRRDVDAGNKEKLFEFVKETYPVVSVIESGMLKEAARAMAFKNATVSAFNEFYIQHKMVGPIIRLYSLCPVKKELKRTEYLDVKSNCLIFVTQNGFSSVSNGTSLIFQEYLADKDVLLCHQKNGTKVTVSRNNMGKFPIEIGFAGTLHKFQGQTLDEDKIVISLDGSEDLNLIYTALSRIKCLEQILAIKL